MMRLVLAAVLLSGCSMLNEDVDVGIDCEMDMFATTCEAGQVIGCNQRGEVVAVECDQGLTCLRLTQGGETRGVCAPDCDAASPRKVCAGSVLLECSGNQVSSTDCASGGQSCNEPAGMEARCE